MRAKKVFAHLVAQKKLVRQTLKTAAALGLAVVMVLMNSIDAMACASCGCTLSSDWANLQSPVSYSPGVKLDLRYDYLNQDQLRSGHGTISPTDASKITNNGDPQEVEKYTVNNYLTLGIDYSNSREWGVNVQVPWINRNHSTLGTASDGITPGAGGGQFNSHTSSVGDVKVIGRYQGFTQQCNFGILYGVKLPTGSFMETGVSTDPTAPGPVPIDRGLQPGTGTTDAILGAYYSNSINQDWDYFTQAIYQKALNSRNDYKPGAGLNLNVGLRYAGFSSFAPQIQLNFRDVQRDEGAQADTVSTGGKLLYISPGITAPVSQQLSVYGFVQLPVYQYVNGVQLAPRYTASAGVRYAF
jgi:hypothetical protein